MTDAPDRIVIMLIAMIHPCGAAHATFILHHRESSPHKKNRVTMDGSTFLLYQPARAWAQDGNIIMSTNNGKTILSLKKPSLDSLNRILENKLSRANICSIVKTSKEKQKLLNGFGYDVNADGSKVEYKDARYILFELEGCIKKNNDQIYGWHYRKTLDEIFDLQNIEWGSLDDFKKAVVRNNRYTIGPLRFDSFVDGYLFLKELSISAMPEDWSLGADTTIMMWPGLEYFIRHTTERILHNYNENGANLLLFSKDKKRILYNTGLRDNRNGHILVSGEVKFTNGKVKEIRHPHIHFQDSDDWKLTFKDDDINAKLFANPNNEVFQHYFNWEIDNAARVQKGSSCAEDIYYRHQRFTNNSPLPEDVLKEINMDNKIGVPMYYPRICRDYISYELQLLIPIYWNDKHGKEYTYALSLVLDEEKKKYIPDTIWSLETAYLNARLISQPKAEWLSLENINKQKHM